jgi:hypothetical protein
MKLYSDFYSDVPPVISLERRRQPDRRTEWRGGRRDSDWRNRPAGAWKEGKTPTGAMNLWSRLFQR